MHLSKHDRNALKDTAMWFCYRTMLRITAKSVEDTFKSLGWDILPHPPYPPDLPPFDYHLLASMGHALVEQHSSNFEKVWKSLDEWFAVKDKQFFWHGIYKLLEMGRKRWPIFWIKEYYFPLKLLCFYLPKNRKYLMHKYGKANNYNLILNNIEGILKRYARNVT